jgi:hypothetical protein
MDHTGSPLEGRDEMEQNEIVNRHLPLKVRSVCHAEVIESGHAWRSDIRISVLLPYDVDTRSLSGQVDPDWYWDVTSEGATVTIGHLSVATDDDFVAPPDLQHPERVFTITVPLTRGKPVHTPVWDRVHINPEAEHCIHHTVKVPGVTRSGRSCMFRVRTKIDPQTGAGYLASINADPWDADRVKENFVNFGAMCKRAGRAIKRAFDKAAEPAAQPPRTAGPTDASGEASNDAQVLSVPYVEDTSKSQHVDQAPNSWTLEPSEG